jgi:hypothetical protein
MRWLADLPGIRVLARFQAASRSHHALSLIAAALSFWSKGASAFGALDNAKRPKWPGEAGSQRRPQRAFLNFLEK